MLYLYIVLVVQFRIAGSVLKRESGASPEQTRCCKFTKALHSTYTTGY